MKVPPTGQAPSPSAEPKATTPYARARQIISEVAQKHDLSVEGLLERRRYPGLVRARWEAMWRLRDETTLSLPEIAQRLGLADHTTVLYGIRAHAKRMAEGA